MPTAYLIYIIAGFAVTTYYGNKNGHFRTVSTEEFFSTLLAYLVHGLMTWPAIPVMSAYQKFKKKREEKKEMEDIAINGPRIPDGLRGAAYLEVLDLKAMIPAHQRNLLDFDDFAAYDTGRCYYGQMYGNYHSESCADMRNKFKGTFTYRYLTSLENYALYQRANNKAIVEFLRGERKNLFLTDL